MRSAPTHVGGYDTVDQARGVALAGNYAYVADDDAGLQIIDVSNPALPMRAGVFDTRDRALGVAVSSNSSRLRQLRLCRGEFCGTGSDRRERSGGPIQTGVYATRDYVSRVAVSGNYAYLTADEAGFPVIDVSHPAAPAQVGVYQTGDDPVALAVSGRYAYVTYEVIGLEVIDVSNPAAPVRVGGYPTSDSAYGVTVDGNYVYVANGSAGLLVLDVTKPASPLLVGVHDTSGWASGLAVSENQVYIADGDWGLAIFKFSPPSARVVLTWPASEHSFSLLSASSVHGPWLPFGGTVLASNGQNEATVHAVENARFFRLEESYGQMAMLEAPLPVGELDARDRGPSLSADGLSLYFCSDVRGDMDLWVTIRASLSSPWGEPTPLDTINSTSDEAFPEVSADGLSLFFSDWFLFFGNLRPDGSGAGDLWVSTRASPAAAWLAPVNLGPVVNTAFAEAMPTLSSDGRTLIFATDRPGNVPGSGTGFNALDLWITTRTDATDPTDWAEPVNLGAVVNSIHADWSPHLSRDGLALYFTSNRPGLGRPDVFYNLWVARRRTTSEPFAAPVNLESHFTQLRDLLDPCLSPDGATLLFATRGLLADPAPRGKVDLWQSAVLRPPPLTISRTEPAVPP